MSSPRKLVVLISGSGTNLQALIDAQNTESLPHTQITLVLSNRKAAYGLTRAQQATPPIPTAYLALQPYLKANPGKTRDDYDAEVAKIILKEKPDLVVLAGWMHVLGDGFLNLTNGTEPHIPVINLHPALPGAFDGANAIERAYEAAQKGEISHSGVMVHKVVKEVDRGEPLIVREIPIEKGEPLETFAQRLHSVEWEIIVQATKKVLDEVKPIQNSHRSTRQQNHHQMPENPSPKWSGPPRWTDMGQPGAGPWKYTLLSESHLSTEISRIAVTAPGTAHVASFQPNEAPTSGIGNQDRYVVEDWDIRGELWRFRAVFDGHANGNETVEYAFQSLPSSVRERLIDRGSADASSDPDTVKSLLTSAMIDLDDSITKGLLSLFPTEKSIQDLSDDEIRRIVNDKDTGGANFTKVARAMRGTTAIVALVGPNGDVWTATVGDSQAVIGIKNASGEWSTKSLSSNHNANEATEIERVRKEHPGEDLAITDGRVLGVIAVTRAIGDHMFKLPSLYTSRVFSNVNGGFRPGPEEAAKIAKVVMRNVTPPYLNSVPDIVHLNLKDEGATHACLILCSDGLIDLYSDDNQRVASELNMALMATPWIRTVGDESLKPLPSGKTGEVKANLALRLVYEGLGGGTGQNDLDRISRMITVEMDDKWMDDTTVVVEGLNV
ncbi:hypothetical protein V5O48_003161 [Marasmius crinis-equi]|uniref:phosphoribosylglycinamide formyltransferase 1 n=1 Tax=Marasmius crinis-equi TaxID=585013 RepID=A0ABR3FTL8_9AGAR